MQVELQSSEGLTRRLAVEIPASEIDEQVERRLKDMRGRVRVDGFRPGKAPTQVVRQRYGKQVRDDVVNEMLGQTYQQAVNEQELRVAGRPMIESLEGNEPGANLKYVAAVEVYPEIELGDLSALEIETIKAEVKDEDIDEMIDTLRTQHSDWKATRRKAKKGERLTLNFVGTIDGEEFEGGKGEDMQVVLGENQLIKDFEKNLKGLKKGEEVDFEVTFPEDYAAEKLAGKTANFHVEVTKTEERVLPEVDDEFAQKFGSDDAESFKKDVRENMERELAQTLRRKNKDATIETLTESLEFDVPKALIDDEAVSMRDQFVQNQMPDAEKDKLDPSLFNEQAEKRVRMGLVIMEVVRSADLQVDDARVDEWLNEVASAYDEPEQVIAAYKGDQQMMSNARTVVLEQQATEYIQDQAKVTEVEQSFKDVMNPQGQ